MQFSVAPNYEWIDVRVGCTADSGVSDAARAALLVWRALAACRGFSAREHPRVLALRVRHHRDRFQATHTAERLERDLRILSGEIDCAVLQTQVEATLKTLEPFVRRERLQQTATIECHINVRPEYMNDDVDLNALIDLLQRSEPPPGASTHDLALVVTAVDTGSRVTGYLSPDFAQHISSGRDLRVPIAR
ncbi:hypothetical protein PINS_up023423 [Pythium insidiosum]|nr:hypothetical protein PINS_up023423 [Pythium insidiosum]